RVVQLAREALEARDLRDPRYRQASRRHDQEGGGEAPAVVRTDRPALARLVPGRLDHPRTEPDVAAQVEAIGDVLEVREDLGLGRVALGPRPLLLELVRPRVGVGHAFDVAARPGVAV